MNTKFYYNSLLTPDEQISVEEEIAALLFDDIEYPPHEEACAKMGRKILLHVLRRFRPDMIEEAREEDAWTP